MSVLPKELVSAKVFYTFLSVGIKESRFLEKYSAYRYTYTKIPKRRGGTRTLLIPERRLKFLQRKTLTLLEKVHATRLPVHGFVKNRGTITNANAHQTRPFLLNLDLREFFASITRRRVIGMLLAIGIEGEVAEAICSICVTRNQLPQGAPTSPILSNMIAYRLDRDLMSFARDHRFRYTRYADDITLSSYAQPLALFDLGMPPPGRVPVEQLSASLRSIISSNGFEISAEKVWYSDRSSRKEVTGLIVNEFTNIKRSFVRDLRAAIYKVEKIGLSAAEKDYQKRYKTKKPLEKIIRGRLEWIAQVRGRSFSAYRTLAKRFNLLFPTSALSILPTYAEIAESSVWVLEFFVGQECEQGTAFFLEGVGLVTASHVLEKLPSGASAELHRPGKPGKKFKVTPSKRRCAQRDLLILDHNIPIDEHLVLPLASAPEHTEDNIFALGFPDFGPGDELSKRRGHIVGRATKHGVRLIEVSAILPGGMSGGPVVNERYQVIGIVRSGGNQEHKQFAVEVSELLDLAKG